MFNASVIAAAAAGAAPLHRAPVGDAISGEFVVRFRGAQRSDELQERIQGKRFLD